MRRPRESSIQPPRRASSAGRPLGRSSLNSTSSVRSLSQDRNKNVTSRKKSVPKSANTPPVDRFFIPEHERLLKRYLSRILHAVEDQIMMAGTSPEIDAFYAQMKEQALTVYNGDGFSTTQASIRQLVDKRSLKIRSEADISADVGLRETVTHLVKQYHPNWLRLGLEIVLDMEVRTVTNHQQLRKMLDTFVFSNAAIRERYAGECLVPSGKKEAMMKEDMWAHCLSTLLLLVHLLDALYMSELIPRWRCLFITSAQAAGSPVNPPVKSSKVMLQQLGSLLVEGRGDLPTFLRKYQVNVSYEQQLAHEVNYGLRNLVHDAQDGLRFAQAIDLMSNRPDKLIYGLHAQDDLSSVKRKANVEKVLARVKADGLSTAAIDAGKVAVGEPNQVVRLAWAIAYHYGSSWIMNPFRVLQQAHYITGAPVVINPPPRSEKAMKTVLEQALFTWALAIGTKAGLAVNNLGVAFADGLLFCRIVQYYDPWLLDEEVLQDDNASKIGRAHV